MIKELFKIGEYINQLEEENKELREEIKNLQQDCKDWEEMYNELKIRKHD